MKFSKINFVYSAKPGFFHDEIRANLFEVEPQTGMLINTDNGSPMPEVSVILIILLHEVCIFLQVFNFVSNLPIR